MKLSIASVIILGLICCHGGMDYAVAATVSTFEIEHSFGDGKSFKKAGSFSIPEVRLHHNLEF